MIGQDHEPLTPEERELAQRLARLGAQAEPSAALDAGILAAARAATGGKTARPAEATGRRRHPRFFRAAGLGIAASLVFAVGIAWQLRPLPDAGVEYSEAPSAAALEPAQDASAAAEMRAPQAFPAPSSPGLPPAEEVAARGSAAQAIEPPREQKQSAPAQSASEGANTTADEAPVVFDDASTLDAQAPQPAPPPPPPPPASPPSPAPEPDLSVLPAAGTISPRVMRDASGERESESRTRAREAMPEADAQRRAESLDRIEVTGTRIRQDEADFFHDQPYDDEPPASADSPEVRKAWLARIRELVDEGRIDAARASLAEFRRRYPEASLPDDLRTLLE